MKRIKTFFIYHFNWYLTAIEIKLDIKLKIYKKLRLQEKNNSSGS